MLVILALLQQQYSINKHSINYYYYYFYLLLQLRQLLPPLLLFWSLSSTSSSWRSQFPLPSVVVALTFACAKIILCLLLVDSFLVL